MKIDQRLDTDSALLEKDEKWNEIESFLSESDLADECVVDNEGYDDFTTFRLLRNRVWLDVVKYPSEDIWQLSIEDFELDLKDVAERPYGNDRELIQHVYDYLKEHDDWPDAKLLRVELREMGNIYDIAEDRRQMDQDRRRAYGRQAVSFDSKSTFRL